ncbi:MAG: DNA helicase PcrA [Clostridia bacterium]|nr:DNA helicase PcrA [Clostridia bacterium]
MSILENLNPQQQEAVQCTEGPLLILAGAGSGKTRVLTHRIAYLIYEKKVYPGNILAITFTNKAAQEMQERLEKLVGSAAERLWVATFHSTCLRILRWEIKELGYTSDFVIYDEQDQQTLLKSILKEMNLDENKYTPRSISARISGYKNELKTPDAALREIGNSYYDHQVINIYEEYQKRLKKNNALDFDDLIMLTVKLFKEKPEVLAEYQERFKYILVDEYQDTNTAQYMLINLLAAKHKNLCVVGDDDQSIYQWRGADIRNILSFEEDYPEAKVIKLEQNYRSTKNILGAANEVVKNNTRRKAKTLWTEKEGGDKIHYYTAQDEVDEALFIVRTVRQIREEENKDYKDFAVLCRTTGQFRAIEESLIRANIPYRVFGGTKFYDRKEIKDILAYLRVIANPFDEVSLKRIINTPKRGIGETSWDKLVKYANTNGKTIYDCMAEPEAAGIGAKTAAAVKAFRKQMEGFKELSNSNITFLTTKILEDTGYRQELELEKTIEAETRLENLQEFLTVTKRYDAESQGGDLAAFLAEISLMTDIDNYDSDEDAMVIMTMHGAKGLEFPVVFITGMEENLFPHSRSIASNDPEEIEEERRLCYVALTRAKEKAFLTRAWRRSIFGRDSFNKESRFIGEIPEKYLENPLKREKAAFSGSLLSGAPSSVSRASSSCSFYVGDKVTHVKWGQGVVVSVKGTGEDAEISVAFPDQGIKKLIAKYAPLKKVTN